MKKHSLKIIPVTLGLKHRIFVLFTVIMLLLMAVIGYRAYNRSINNFRSILSRHLELAEETINIKFQSQLNDAISFLHIASDNRVSDFLTAETKLSFLATSSIIPDLFTEHRSIRLANQDIHDIKIIGAKGRCFSERFGYFQLKNDFASYDFALATIMNPHRNIIHENPVILQDNISDELLTVTTGIFLPGTEELIGTVHVEIKKSSLEKALDEVKWSPTSLVTIANQEGRPILHSKNGGFPANSLHEILAVDLSAASSPWRIDQVDYLVFYDSLSFAPWKLVVGVQLGALMSPQYYIGNALLAAIIIIIMIIVFSNIFLSAYLVEPILGLKELMKRAAEGDFDVETDYQEKNALAELYQSFGKMTTQIKQLLESQLLEQDKRKSSELKLLQAQINPHFLYNTLDAVVRVAEAGKNDEVIDLIIALSRFYRSVLNISSDLVSISTAVEHAESFLIIMKKRYHDLLDYSINIDERVLNASFPKLSIQPLLENAIYHGIKNRKDGGLVKLDIQLNPENMIEITVSDNGTGMTEVQLNNLHEKLSNMSHNGKEAFGLRNINDRIKLIFGKKYGLEITSEYMVGTSIKTVIPFKKMEEGSGYVSSFDSRRRDH